MTRTPSHFCAMSAQVVAATAASSLEAVPAAAGAAASSAGIGGGKQLSSGWQCEAGSLLPLARAGGGPGVTRGEWESP